MGVQNTTLLAGATVSATGGTAKDFVLSPVEIASGIHLVEDGVADFKTTDQLTLKARLPQLNNGKYGKGKRWATLVAPMETADGETVFNLVRIEAERHPEMSESDYMDMLKQAAQLFIDSDLDSFWKTGALS